MFCGTDPSQFNFSNHNSYKKIFDVIITDVKIPRGSKSVDAVDKMERFVILRQTRKENKQDFDSISNQVC